MAGCKPLRCSLVGLLAAAAIAVSGASSVGAQSSSIDISAERVGLTADQPATVEVTNVTAAPVTITFTASAGSPASQLITSPNEPTQVAPGASIKVSIATPSHLDATASLEGALLIDTGNGRLDVVDLQVGPRNSPVTEVKSHTVVVYTLFFGATTPRSDLIPADTTACSGEDTARWTRNFTATSGRHHINVAATCTTGGLEVSADKLRFDEHATYRGTLSGAGSDIEVKILWTTFIGWPVLVMALGFWAGLSVHRWTKGGRDFRLTRERLRNLHLAALDADLAFAKQAHGNAWARLRIADSVKRTADDLIARFTAIDQRRGGLGFVTDEQKASLEELLTAAAPTETAIERWNTQAADSLQTLRTIRDTETGAWAVVPNTTAEIDQLLSGSWVDDEVDVGRIVSAASKAPRAVKLLTAYAKADASLDDAITMVEPTAGLTDHASDLRASLKRKLQGEDQPDGVTTLAEVVGLESEIIKFLDAVAAVERELASFETLGLPPTAELSPGDTTEDESETITQSVLERLLQGRVRATVGTRDRWAFALIGFVAVWSGLQALYFGKPWGNLIDYVAAFTWAFAATATLALALSLVTQPNARLFRISNDD